MDGTSHWNITFHEGDFSGVPIMSRGRFFQHLSRVIREILWWFFLKLVTAIGIYKVLIKIFLEVVWICRRIKRMHGSRNKAFLLRIAYERTSHKRFHFLFPFHHIYIHKILSMVFFKSAQKITLFLSERTNVFFNCFSRKNKNLCLTKIKLIYN